MVKRVSVRPRLGFVGGGRGVACHVGARLLADLADNVGLARALSEAMADTKVRRRGRDRGRVLADAAVMVADGGESICDISVLAGRPEVFGEVASPSTLWRAPEAAGGRIEEIEAARAHTRRRVWAAGADPGFCVIDIDAALVESHSDKQAAAGTCKGGFGFCPLLGCLDAAGECLAGVLRAGSAGSDTAADHVEVLSEALDQIPVDPHSTEVIARADTAGCARAFLNECRARGVRFCVGHPLSIDIAQAITEVGDKHWRRAISADGEELLDRADVAETTDHTDLSQFPAGCRMIARRELPHRGAQLNSTDADGHRFQAPVTDIADNDADSTDIAYTEALHRGRGRAERQITDHNNTGLAKLASHCLAINAAWLQITMCGHDLPAWTKLLALDEDPAKTEPERLRYCLLHTAGRIVNTGRRRTCKLPNDWPRTPHLLAAHQRIHNLPPLIRTRVRGHPDTAAHTVRPTRTRNPNPHPEPAPRTAPTRPRSATNPTPAAAPPTQPQRLPPTTAY